MTEEPICVDDVDVVRAPGFDSGGFTVDDLCEGINVVHGPNASGKTTLARSIRWLLWPENAVERASITGRLSLDGQEWRVDVDRGRIDYQRDGQTANGPGLPPSAEQDRYVLSLHELLQEETRDESFAEAIERESAGGYDLSAAAEELVYDDSPITRGKSEVKEAETAVDELRKAEREIEALRDEQRRLPSLQRELEEAKEARERARLLEQAIEYAEARDALQDAEDALEEFPDTLDRIDGDEAETVAEFVERIGEWEEKKADAETALADAEERIDEADLPDGGLPDGFVDRLKQQRDTLRTLEDRKCQREGDLADYESRRSSAREEVPIDVSGDDLASLDPAAWEEISEFAKQAERVRADRELQEAVDRWLSSDERPDDDLSTLQRGREALEQWLANPPVESTGDDGAAMAIAAVSAVLLTATSIALGFFVTPVGYLPVVVALGLLWYAYRARASGDVVANPRETYRDTFRDLDLDAPDSWTESNVRHHLRELYDAIADHHLADEREQQREARTSTVDDLEHREESLAEARTELKDRVGAAPDTTDVELVVTTKAILRWQEAHDEVLGLEKKIDEIETQIEEKRSKIADELDPYGYEAIDDAAEATEHIRDLANRGDEHDDATKTSTDAEETIEEAERKLDELREQRDEVFSDIGLEPDEVDRLRSLCEKADAYEDAEQKRGKAKLLAESEEADLETMPRYEEDLKDQPVAELEREKRDAEEIASSYDSVHESITEIETKIDEAKRDNKLEEAIAEKDRALDELADQLDDDRDSMVGHILTERVREATTDANRPDVFRHAREVLVRISKGRYRLDFDDDETAFRAYDTIKERGFALDELSSATRLQVLLAVRIAFVERHEGGTRLPLLLDETLANSDDGKAEVIIESVLELAREGRQVFYFTAQGDEVSKWLAAIEEADVEHSVIDLADVQGLDRHVTVPDLDDLAERSDSPPDPADHDHESYGLALGVPPFDPRQGAGAAHLWYVVDDLELLHRLLELDIERCGQLENLLSSARGAIAGDDPERLDRVACNGEALEEFVRSWRRGRGERVDRDVLEASGAVSENFIVEVSKLAEDVNGDGERIIRALRDGHVNRFRSGKIDELEAYFEENGHIEPIDPLEPEQIRLRVIDCLVENGVSHEQATERGQELLTRLSSVAEDPSSQMAD